jgi:hypothetical protein
MLAHAQNLVYTLKELMPTQYQKDNLEAMLALFLEAQGHPLPEHSQTKSPSAISRFLNINPWSTREMIRVIRSSAVQTVRNVLSTYLCIFFYLILNALLTLHVVVVLTFIFPGARCELIREYAGTFPT